MAKRRRRGTRKGQMRKTSRRAFVSTVPKRRRKANNMGGSVRIELVSGAAGAGVGIVVAEAIEESTDNAYGGFVVTALGLLIARQTRGRNMKSFGAGMAVGGAGMTVANLVEAPVRQLVAPIISGTLPAPAGNGGNGD
jgi:hypothetical protein